MPDLGYERDSLALRLPESSIASLRAALSSWKIWCMARESISNYDLAAGMAGAVSPSPKKQYSTYQRLRRTLLMSRASLSRQD